MLASFDSLIAQITNATALGVGGRGEGREGVLIIMDNMRRMRPKGETFFRMEVYFRKGSENCHLDIKRSFQNFSNRLNENR